VISIFISGEAAGEAVEMQIRTDDKQSKSKETKIYGVKPIMYKESRTRTVN
jgi:hypothetical protein